jgi:hypothetical protein
MLRLSVPPLTGVRPTVPLGTGAKGLPTSVSVPPRYGLSASGLEVNRP